MAEKRASDKRLRYANLSRTIRFTDELFEQLQETANSQHLSFNLLVLKCCDYALRNYKDRDS